MERKPIEIRRVFYQRNVGLGIDLECHECISHVGRSRDGYVPMGRDGFYLMHRWIYWQHMGESPEVVMHLCDHPWCVNIDHLVGGTQGENVRDMLSKRRGGLAKLTDEQVMQMRQLREEGVMVRDLAEMFGVCRETVWFAVTLGHYSYVSG